MKKLLILTVICLITSLANALPVLTVDGQPGVGEIVIIDVPSGTATIGANIDPGLIGGTIDFVLSSGLASLDGSGMAFNPDYRLASVADMPWDFAWVENVGSTPTSVTIGGGNMSSPNTDNRWVMDGLLLHCEGLGDVTLSMIVGVGGLDYEGGVVIDVPEGTLLGSVVVHQIPEPMTVCLLGLGGLFLRKRLTA